MTTKEYELWYWNYDPMHERETKLMAKDVLVPAETFKQMQSHKQPAFYKFYINDGEDFYIAAGYVHSLRQVFNNQSS